VTAGCTLSFGIREHYHPAAPPHIQRTGADEQSLQWLAAALATVQQTVRRALYSGNESVPSLWVRCRKQSKASECHPSASWSDGQNRGQHGAFTTRVTWLESASQT